MIQLLQNDSELVNEVRAALGSPSFAGVCCRCPSRTKKSERKYTEPAGFEAETIELTKFAMSYSRFRISNADCSHFRFPLRNDPSTKSLPSSSFIETRQRSCLLMLTRLAALATLSQRRGIIGPHLHPSPKKMAGHQLALQGRIASTL